MIAASVRPVISEKNSENMRDALQTSIGESRGFLALDFTIKEINNKKMIYVPFIVQ